MMFERQRLHPVLILLTLIQSLREMLLPLLLLTFSALNDGGFQWWKGLGFIAIIIFVPLSSFFRWFRYFYYVTEREVRIEYGLFVRKQRYIPYERIRSISLTQGVIHRVFGLVKLQIETAGGGDELAAMTREQAEQLKEWIRERSEDSTELMIAQEQKEDVHSEYKLSTKALFIVASTSGGFGIVFSFVGALFTQIENFLPERYLTGVFDKIVASSVLFVASAILFIAVIAWVVSIINTVLRFGRFVLQKTAKELLITRGILEKKQLTIPIAKIQAVRIEQGVLRQPFNVASIYVEVAGGSSLETDMSTVIHPLIRTKDIPDFIMNVLPAFAADVHFHSVPKRARRRYLIRSTWFTLPFIGLAMWLLPLQVAIFSSLLFLLGLVNGYWKHRDAAWFLTEELLAIRYRKWGRTTVFTPRGRIQSYGNTQSLLQKRRQLADFGISILGGIVGSTFSVQDIEKEKADELFHELRQPS